MPQNLTPEWQEELGTDKYEQIHERWLHGIANLTLSSYNSRYSNSPFHIKKSTENGFSDSGIRMNQWIATKNKWGLDELEERNKYLMDRALDIWKYPKTEYKPQEKQLVSCTLDDEVELTNRDIVRFRFRNAEQPVKSWVEMYQSVLQILFSGDKTIITKLALSEDEDIASHFSTNSNKSSKCREVGDGIFVWTNTNTQSKLSILSRLFKLYDENPSNLVFYLRDESKK